MHFLAWTFNWRLRRRSREIARFSSNRIWDSQETQGDLLYISHKKKIRETSGESRVPIDQREGEKFRRQSKEPRRGGTDRRCRGGDRELFLYKRDDNQALVGLIVMLLAKTIIMHARDTRLYGSVICCQRRESKRKSEKRRGGEAWETEAIRALVRTRNRRIDLQCRDFPGGKSPIRRFRVRCLPNAWKNKTYFYFV